MKTKHITKAVTITLLFFAFAYAQAGLIPTVDTTGACHGNDGTVTITGTGVSGPFDIYIWAPWTSQGDSNVATSATFTNLAPGTYQFNVSSSQAQTSGSFTITSVVNAQLATTEPVCPASTTGSAVVTASGGLSPYNYLWNTGATTASVTGLAVGQNWVTVTDQNGCNTVVADSIQIVSPVQNTIAQGGTACAPSLTVTPSGGLSPYSFLWSTGANTGTITNLSTGNYWVTIADANGCMGNGFASVSTTSLIVDSSSSSVQEASCGANGSVDVAMFTGTGPFSYLWSNASTTNPATGLAAGWYSVTVTDVNSCSGQGWFYISDNSTGAYTYTNNPQCGVSDGSITFFPYGGTPPYTTSWSYSGTNHTDTALSLAAGTYSYTVTDAGSCSYSNTVTLTGQGSFAATVTTTPTDCAQNLPSGTATATITNGGTAPFTYYWELWVNGQWTYDTSSSSTITGLAYQTVIYLSAVTDANGCTVGQINNIDSSFINFAPQCYDHITGYVYTDLNGDCMMDQGDPGLGGINVQAVGSNGGYYYANTDSTGFYDIEVFAGNYTVTANTYNSGYCSATSCNSMYSDSLAGTGNVSTGNNFGFSGTETFDLGVHPGYTPSYPGGTKEYWVYYYNRGTTSVSGVVLTFIHDSNLTLTSTNPPYSSYDPATYTITWNIGTVPVNYWNSNQQVTMEFNVPSTLGLGTLLSLTAIITPITGDCNPSDNTETLTDPVTASHDPNVKQVSPAGDITTSDSVLTYTIRFQNTGNAPATRVVIIDTLSPLVNPASVSPGASSSPYKFTLSGNGILTFTFDPIYLPDSAQSADSSTGFVMYSVNIRGNDAIGSQIKNNASIYFDQNPAVVTNTTVNTISLSNGIRNLTAGGMSVNVSPNPVHDKALFSIEGATGEVQFELTDITGKKMFETSTTSNNLVLEGSPFAAGMYIYTARDATGNSCTGKVIITR